MFKNDGSHWFLLELDTFRSRDGTESELVQVWYEDPSSGDFLKEQFRDAIIPIVPRSWYHVCMGLDTVSGLLRIVVNGVLVVNKEREYFKNTEAWAPTSVAGKILVYKGYITGFWYQYRGTSSNMNIFRSVLSIENMSQWSSGGSSDCLAPGDYLRSSYMSLDQPRLKTSILLTQLGGDGLEHYGGGHKRHGR